MPAPLPAKLPPLQKQSVPAWFIAQERNGDQVNSPREFLGPAEIFHQLDQDGNGLIDPAESEVDR